MQDHSQPIAGKVLVTMGSGAEVILDPYSTAQEVEDKFSEAGHPVRVTRTGTCQTGFGWVLAMTHSPGDQPLMQAVMKAEGETNAAVEVRPYVDGGILMAPLSVDYMHRSTTDTNIQVLVDEGAAHCALNEDNITTCLFKFDDALTPTLTAITSSHEGIGAYTVTITGIGLDALEELPSDAAVSVKVGSSVDCVVTAYSDTSVEFLVARPFLQAGTHSITVYVPGKGIARGSILFDYELEISGVVPSNLNRDIVNQVTIQGAGFHPDLSKNQLSIGGDTCEPISVSASELVCTLGPEAGGSRRRQLQSTQQVSLQLEGTSLSAINEEVTAAPSSVPTVTTVTPSVGAVAGGFRVTISGSLFSTTSDDNKVLLGAGGTPCAVIESSTTSITCMAGSGAIGVGAVTVLVEGSGVSDQSTSPQFQYEFAVQTLVGGREFSFGGGGTVTCTGSGFESSTDVRATAAVAVAGRETYIVGVFLPQWTPEIHDILLTTDWGNGYYFATNPPSGTYSLKLGNTSIGSLSASASAGDVQQLISSIPYFGRVDVLKRREIISGEDTERWIITFLVCMSEKRVSVFVFSSCSGIRICSCPVYSGVQKRLVYHVVCMQVYRWMIHHSLSNQGHVIILFSAGLTWSSRRHVSRH